MMSSSDPRVHKPRVPKAYSEAELAFLKSHLPEFERRSQGSIRGDAKKFALEQATEFITTFGLPAEFQDVTEPEPRFREQIYNWYKNTIGRTRRKLEGKPRSSKKAAEKAAQNNSFSWTTNLATPTTVPYSQLTSSTRAIPHTTVLTPPYYPNLPSTSASTSGSSANLKPKLNVSNLSDAFLNHAVDASTLSTMIQTSVLSSTSRTPLTSVIQSLFEAITVAQSSQSSSSAMSYPNGDPSYQLLRRFVEACNFFPPTISHANVSGPLAGPRALQMAIRVSSVWTSMGHTPSLPSSGPSMSHEMERIAIDRQRRKDYIQWARVHAAALELGMLSVNGDPNGGMFVSGRSASEVMARDSVWQEDEVEWCAGICVLRAIIRTGLRGAPAQRQEYEDLLRTYEGRWKEIKDEARQALVTEVLLAAKDELARLMEQPQSA